MRSTLSNPNATRETVRLYAYLRSMVGNGILAGQQECPTPGRFGGEMRYLRAVSGKLPAIRGLDFIHNDFDGVVRRSRAWHKMGGIVSICWHWGTPPDGVGYPSSQGQIDLEEALTPGTALYEAMLERMDEAAQALKRLQRSKIPVLWRPLHEFDGGWFWWGKGGGDAFIRLWRLMYERYTHYHGLNNLIWVLGYCGEIKEGWYPGDDCVDIVGADTYTEGAHVAMYHRLEQFFGDRFLRTYHECGPIPEPEELLEKDLRWSWFLTWHHYHIRHQNTREKVARIYNHPYVITLDKLPRWAQEE